MDKKEAFQIVLDDLMKEDGCGLFRGIYDAANGKKSYMSGIATVVGYIACSVSPEEYERCDKLFTDNMLKSEDRARLKLVKKVKETNERYKDFVILDEPRSFSDLFAEENISCVQIHSTVSVGTDDIVGFCGAFKWENDEITSLDGDSYYKNTTVYGYSWFKDDEGRPCLDILAGDNW